MYTNPNYSPLLTYLLSPHDSPTKFSLSTRLEDLRLGALSARLHTKVVRGHYEGKNAIRRY